MKKLLIALAGGDDISSWLRAADMFLLGIVVVAIVGLVAGDQISFRPQAMGAAEKKELINLDSPIPAYANFSVSAIGGLLTMKSKELDPEKSNEEMVWEGKRWSAEAETRSKLTSCLRPWHGDLSGVWSISGELDGSRLEIEEAEGESWAVGFKTWGCLMDWNMLRSGTIRDGALQLDGPVVTYSPGEPFSVLFMAEIESRKVLVPSGYAVILNRLAGFEGCEGLSMRKVGGGVYVRASSRDGASEELGASLNRTRTPSR